MPRVETRYYCNKCGATWKSEEKANECEESHLTPKSIDGASYSMVDINNKYPLSITVQFENGVYATYVRNAF